MFDSLKDKVAPLLISKKQKKINKMRDMVMASYYSATSESPSMDFSFAGSETLNQALRADLQTLRNRIRYELRQNGPAKGMLKTYANACVATGPTLSVESEDKEWNEALERWFAKWAMQAGYTRGESLAEILHLGVRQFFVAGEFFNLYKSDSSTDFPVKLKLLLIRPDRIASPYTGVEVNEFAGITFDSNSRPISYSIRTDNTLNYLQSYEFVRESAKNVAHIFQSDEPEQYRGEPWLAAGLPDLHMRRRYDEARVAAAVVAAKFAVFLTSTNTDVSPEDVLPEGIIDLNDGAATILPPGYGVASFSGSQPASGATDFRREMIANAGAAAGMSSNAANNDSGNASFASARYDDVGFGLEQEVVRGIIGNRFLNNTAQRFTREAVAMRLVPPAPMDYRFVWRWPMAARHTDPLKYANANKIRMSTGEASLSDIWAEQGHDKDQMRLALLEDIKWYESHGLIHPMVNPMVQDVIEDPAQAIDQNGELI